MGLLGYQVLVIDPPWPQKKGGFRSIAPRQGRELDYDTMSIADIFGLLDREVFPLAAARHVVFLWTIDKFLLEAEEAMAQCDYKRHARLIWDKGNGIAPAFTIRFSHEYLIWYYRSPLLPVATEARGKFTTVLRAPGEEHSRKPDIAYDIIHALYPNYRKLDVFSREPRPGWDSWGDQTGLFTHQERLWPAYFGTTT